MARSTHIAALVIGLLSGTAVAHPQGASPSDDIPTPAPTYKANGVTVDERVGAKIPLDAAFRTSEGKPTTLAELISGDLPTILTFNYSDCPMLCSLQLNGLSTVLPKIAEPVDIDGPDGKKTVAFRTGGQFRIITIDLEPTESLDKLAKMKARYIAKLPEAQRGPAEKGWTFVAAAVPGDAAAIRRVAESVGFKYVYVEDRAEWAHPAALMFLSTTGVVTRYVYGIEYDPQIIRESIIKAGLAEPATAVGFMNRCYHFDPDANSHTRAGVFALRLGAAGFLVLLVGGLGVVHVRRRRRDSGDS